MDRVLVTCEHAGNDVPSEFAHLFVEHGDLLPTHRGWDPGALLLAREMAARFGAPLHYDTVTRLVVDLNRSTGTPSLHAPEFRHRLSAAERQRIVERWWRPHRQAVDAAVDSLAREGSVVHVASHSFTPVLDGVVRTCDVGILYDPKRPGEAAFASCWIDALRERDPTLRLRRNYPYLGASDGIMPPLRRRFAPDRYVGIELEVNQRFVEEGGPAWPAVRATVVDALAAALRAFAAPRPRAVTA